MDEERFFAVVASLALLVWLVGRGGMVRDPRRRRQAELVAFGLVGVALLYAVFRSVAYFLG